MWPDPIDAAVRALFQQLFSIPSDEVGDDTRRGVLERWDSLGHLNLIGALQETFDIEIPLEMALKLETLRDVKRIVAQLQPVSPEPRA